MQGVHIFNATVSEKGGRWFVSLQVELEMPDPQNTKRPVVGLDLGINRLAQLSDGDYFENPRALKNALAKLKRQQRVISAVKKEVLTTKGLYINLREPMRMWRTSEKTLSIRPPHGWRKPSQQSCWRT